MPLSYPLDNNAYADSKLVEANQYTDLKVSEIASPVNLNQGLVGAWSGNVPEYPDNPAGTQWLRTTFALVDIAAGTGGPEATKYAWADQSDFDNYGLQIVNGIMQFEKRAGGIAGGILRINQDARNKTRRLKIKPSANCVLSINNDGNNYFKLCFGNQWNVIDVSFDGSGANFSDIEDFPVGVHQISFDYIGDGTYSSQALDLSGNGNHAQIFGATPVEGGFSFDGVNDYLDLGDTFKFDRTQAFSIYLPIRTGTIPSDNVIRYIAGNLKPEAGAKGWRIASFNTAIQVTLAENHTVNDLVINSSVASDTDYDLVITYDGSSLASGLKLYRNNVVVNAVGGPIAGDTKSPFNTLIGRTPADGTTASAPFSFRYAPRIYNRALTAAEIWELYRNPAGNAVDNVARALTPVPNSIPVRGPSGMIHMARFTPASASAPGEVGSICYDNNYIYICTAANTWKRVAIASW